jgi:AcrR family transcriptional regulator
MSTEAAEDRRAAAKRRRAERTKAELLVAAGTLLKRVSYAQISVNQIARAAGKAHGTFYLYFNNKEDIYASLLEETWAEMNQHSRAVWHADQPVSGIHESVRQYLLSYKDNPELWQLLIDMSVAHPKFQAIKQDRRRRFVNRIRTGITRSAKLADLGDLRVDVVAELLAAMVDEIAVVNFLQGRGFDLDLLVDTITQAWARIVGYSLP